MSSVSGGVPPASTIFSPACTSTNPISTNIVGEMKRQTSRMDAPFSKWGCCLVLFAFVPTPPAAEGYGETPGNLTSVPLVSQPAAGNEDSAVRFFAREPYQPRRFGGAIVGVAKPQQPPASSDHRKTGDTDEARVIVCNGAFAGGRNCQGRFEGQQQKEAVQGHFAAGGQG